MSSKMMICPCCGNYGFGFTNGKCGFCQTEVVDTGYVFTDIMCFDYDEEKKWEEEIFEKFVKPSPLYSPAKRAALPDYKLMEAAEFNPPTAGGVRCPWCGSTQIQMVPRKWSLLTGFLTNKVDRVCVNCKKKF